MKNIRVIGIGPYARRTHLPVLATGQESGLVGTLTGVDVLGASDVEVTYDARPYLLPRLAHLGQAEQR